MTESRRFHLPVWLRGIFLLLSLIVLGLWLKAANVEHWFERPWIDAHVRNGGFRGYWLFVAAGGVITAVGLPRQVVAFFAGYAFGVVPGLLIGNASALLGCLLAYAYARVFGHGLVRHLFPSKVERFDAFVREHPFMLTVVVRLLPVGSNLATNLIAGVSNIPRLAFFAGSFVGYLPQTLVFALAGGGLAVDAHWQVVVSIVLFVLSGLLGVHLYRRMRAGGGGRAVPEAVFEDET